MTQNIIALVIVFMAALYTIVMVVKNLTSKKSAHCGGCSGCSFKEISENKRQVNTTYKYDSNATRSGKPLNRIQTKSVIF